MATTGGQHLYQYSPLPGARWTRVIKLQAGEFRDPLKCSIHPIDLDSAHEPYVALSYRWGQKANTILCDGQTVTANDKLYEAMQRLRERKADVTFWADAISINQAGSPEGLAEKSQQVQLMSVIFSQATTVVADLGYATMEMMAGLDELLGKLYSLPLNQTGSDLVLGPGFQELGLPGIGDPAWSMLDELIRREWFNRVWMIQEFALARRLKMRVGTRLFDFSLIEKASRVYRRMQPPWDVMAAMGPNWARSTRGLELMILVRDLYKSVRPSPLVDLFGMSSNFAATDPRDRIYALTGLVKNPAGADTEPFKIDYAESTHQVAIRFARHLAHARPPSLIWMYAGGPHPHQPSWAPNLESDRQRMPSEGMMPTWQAAPHNPFSAGGTDGSMDPPTFTDDNVTPVLTAYGRVVDTISAVTEIFDIGEQPTATLQSRGESLIDFEQGARRLLVEHGLPAPFRPSDLTVYDPYWLSLVGGTDETFTGRAGSDVRDSFIAFASAGDDISSGRESGDIDDRPDKIAQVLRMYKFMSAFGAAMFQRRLCVTERRRVGNVVAAAKAGDRVVVIRGVDRPVLMREVAVEDGPPSGAVHQPLLQFIGMAYVHGIMEGEAHRETELKMDQIFVV
ncbi:uncharacterized protein PV07_00733 [Cladophialophora immunda]|uniref:Heterokaryon incompatibility domain-containing protein n=1 Tax=Cladophialophora immunda TaxID=569365 RepID=A0A0D2DE05_9EURO|nr:uncharacterized protein PV07_00733 [Cladophialophora immunda]KIW33919.1 hypothetical protein PV07_00733 [Cladophialophora immunda]